MAAAKERAKKDITTQAAERIYRATTGEAKIINTLTLDENCQMDWLPQETILLEGAALKRQLNIEMGESASLLALETLVLGRKAMGETLCKARLSDQWRIRRGGAWYMRMHCGLMRQTSKRIARRPWAAATARWPRWFLSPLMSTRSARR